MSTRDENRKAAYQFILQQSEKISLTSDKVMNYSDSISVSLDELTGLKEGLADTSPALVQALLKILLGAVS